MHVTLLHATACHQHVESMWMVIAARAGDGLVAPAKLCSRGAPEFGAQHQHGVIEHSALAEILDQGGDGLIDLAGEIGMQALDVLV